MNRTDLHNNPTAFTTDIARQAGLILVKEYESGAPFTVAGRTFHTATLIGDPIELTIRVIDRIGYFVANNPSMPRWTYINIPHFVWKSLTPDLKRDVIGFHYQMEGGTEMRHLFPKYGEI